MERDESEQFNLNRYVNSNDEITVNNDTDLRRDVGILNKIRMSWETHMETFFQFKEIYKDRLETLRKAFHMKSNKTIEDLSNDEKICELVGLFKRLEAKRVRAFEPDYEEKYKPNKPLFSEDDTYELEDETSKIKLEIRNFTKINGEGKFIPLQTPYGVVIKCNGEYSAKLNRFIVSNVETPKPAPQQIMRLCKDKPKYMGVYCEPTISELAELLKTLRNRQGFYTLNMCELVIIGGIDLSSVHQSSEYDDLIYQLGALINVYIIPSSGKETSHMYPLAPLPKTLLKKSYFKKNCSNCSNPQILLSKDENIKLEVFISCGENLLNLKANCNISNNLDLMKLMIEYRHACPSSVFSLPIFSYKYDPLLIPSTPHLMIHGKCEKFETEFYERKWNNEVVNVRLVGLAKGDFAYINLSSTALETFLQDSNRQ